MSLKSIRLSLLLCAYFALPSFAIWTEPVWITEKKRKVTYYTSGGKKRSYEEKQVTVGRGSGKVLTLKDSAGFSENLLEDQKKITDKLSELLNGNTMILLSVLIIAVLLFKASQMSLGKKGTSQSK